MLSVVRSGVAGALHEIGVVSDNIANAATKGFKRRLSMFEDVYAENRFAAAKGMGTMNQTARRSHAQGAIVTSQQVLDLAVLGQGMFVLEPRAGEATPHFTRNGSFQLDAAGRIVDIEGRALLGINGGPITIAPNLAVGNGAFAGLSAVSIGPEGTVRASYGDAGTVALGTIALARFPNEQGLRNLGNSLYAATEASGGAIIGSGVTPGWGEVKSGALEASNSDITLELTALIRAQQTFASNAKMMQTSIDLDRKLISG
jgi:flagellar hook protein FlgE